MIAYATVVFVLVAGVWVMVPKEGPDTSVPYDGAADAHPQEGEEYLVCPNCGSPYCGGCD
jgi:hypothetical protein